MRGIKMDIAGQTFGSWTVVERARRSGWWHCRCDCGTEKTVRGDTMKNGTSTKCMACRKNQPLPDIAAGLNPESTEHGQARIAAEHWFVQRQKDWRALLDQGVNELILDGERAVLIPLRNRLVTIADAEFGRFLMLPRWFSNPHTPRPYAMCSSRIDGAARLILMHRVVLSLPHGRQALMVDHINGDTLDNRRVNLRLCSPSENNANTFMRRRNSVGYKGVRIAKGRFLAQISVNGRTQRIGQFNTAREAAEAYDARALEAFGEFAKLNFLAPSNG